MKIIQWAESRRLSLAVSSQLFICTARVFAADPMPAVSPVAAPSAELAAQTSAKGAAVPEYNWTIEDVKRIALENNPDLKSARANYEAASSNVGVAVSGYLPHVDLNAKYDETTLPSPSAGSSANLGTALPYKMISVVINQTLFDFGKTLSQITSSRAISNATEQQAFGVRNALILAVQKTFYEVQSTAQLVAVAEKGLAKFNETLRRTQVLVRTGAKPEFDLSQAKVEVAKAKLALISAENTSDFAKIALLNLMGVRDQVPFALTESRNPGELSGLSSTELDLPKLTEKALQSRPEMKRQQFALDAARSNLSGELKNYLPTIALQGWAGKYLPDYPASLANSWGVAVVGSWHIFQGLETTFRANELSSRVDSQQALIEKDRLSITAEVTRAYKELRRSENNLEVASEILSSSRQNLHLAQRRYDANVSTILELLTAEGSLLGAETTEVTARYDHEIALATLRRVVNAPLREPARTP